jgi:hypothetical protein
MSAKIKVTIEVENEIVYQEGNFSDAKSIRPKDIDTTKYILKYVKQRMNSIENELLEPLADKFFFL